MALDHLCFADFLACTGVLPGPEGFDLETLERFAQVRGWTWTTSPTTALQDPPGEWTASIFAPSTAAGARRLDRPGFARHGPFGTRGAGDGAGDGTHPQGIATSGIGRLLGWASSRHSSASAIVSTTGTPVVPGRSRW